MIAVLGPGGVGGLLTGLLERSGVPVVLIAREQTAAALRDGGLELRSVGYGDFRVRPDVRSELTEDVDALLIATKAPSLGDALTRVHGDCRLVVPLLNGLEHLAWLRERYGERAVAGTVRVNSDRPRTGLIVHANADALVTLASDAPAMRGELDAFAGVLRGAGIRAVVADGEAAVMWRKLVRLNALASTTSASGRTLGEIRADPVWAARLAAVIAEGAAIARTQGAPIVAAQTQAELDSLNHDARSSLARDLDAGRPSELDAIAGAVLRAGDRARVQARELEALVAEIVTRYGVAEPRRPLRAAR